MAVRDPWVPFEKFKPLIGLDSGIFHNLGGLPNTKLYIFYIHIYIY